MPIVIVGYSGGFLPTAWSLEVGGVTNRVRGVVLLDAVYGELDKFASWIENNRSGFFVSSYTRYTKRRDQELMAMLREKGIAVIRRHGWPAAARQRGLRADRRRHHPSRATSRRPGPSTRSRKCWSRWRPRPSLTRIAGGASSAGR